MSGDRGAPPPPFDFDENELDHLAGNMLSAISAVIEFGRGNIANADLFTAATAKALIFAQGALLAFPGEASDDVETALVSHDAALRKIVAEYRAKS